MTNISDEDLSISKSQRKRDMHYLQMLGESLLQLSANELKMLQLPEALEIALLDAKLIQHRSARQRQLQYIGKIMRKLDSIDLLQKIDMAVKPGTNSTIADPKIEKCQTWCKRYLENPDDSLVELIEEFPEIDRQRVRLYARQAQKELARGKPPHAERAMYQYLLNLEQQKL